MGSKVKDASGKSAHKKNEKKNQNNKRVIMNSVFMKVVLFLWQQR